MKMTHGSKPDTTSMCRLYREAITKAHGNAAELAAIFEEMRSVAFVYIRDGDWAERTHGVFVFNDRSWLEVRR